METRQHTGQVPWRKMFDLILSHSITLSVANKLIRKNKLYISCIVFILFRFDSIKANNTCDCIQHWNYSSCVGSSLQYSGSSWIWDGRTYSWLANQNPEQTWTKTKCFSLLSWDTMYQTLREWHQPFHRATDHVNFLIYNGIIEPSQTQADDEVVITKVKKSFRS